MGWFRRKPKESEAVERGEPDHAPAIPQERQEEPSLDFAAGGGVVAIEDDGSISFRVSSVADAKLAIKELKLHKKNLNAMKKAVQLDINAITGEWRDQLAKQCRVVRGGGDIGKAVRAFQSVSRDADKRRHEARLDPHQATKVAIERRTNLIDRTIVQAEAYIHQQETAG